MPPVRKRFDMYANVKPVKSYANIASVHKDVDIVFLRETTEGMQSSGTVVARRPPNMNAEIGTPCGLSQLSSIDGHCAIATVKRAFGCAAGRGGEQHD